MQSEGTIPRVLVLLAEGAEEMEVVITVDVLRRAGIEVLLAGIHGTEPVRCSRGVQLVPDLPLAAASGPFAAVVLPGGAGGSERLAASDAVGALLREQERSGRLIAAICAGPKALVAHGIGRGRRMTCHPSAAGALQDHGELRDEPVVADGPLITSRGPGTAFEFALAIAGRIAGASAAAALRGPLVLSAN
jgi:protein DJ-1